MPCALDHSFEKSEPVKDVNCEYKKYFNKNMRQFGVAHEI